MKTTNLRAPDRRQLEKNLTVLKRLPARDSTGFQQYPRIDGRVAPGTPISMR
jgi:hypothetical protein